MENHNRPKKVHRYFYPHICLLSQTQHYYCTFVMPSCVVLHSSHPIWKENVLSSQNFAPYSYQLQQNVQVSQ